MVDVQIKRVGAAQELGVTDVAACKVGLQHAEVLGLISVEADNMVAEAESHLAGQLVGCYLCVFVADEYLAPDACNEAVHKDGEDEVVQHPSGHDQKPLPSRLGAEFPALRLPLELLQVHRLVHHSGNLAIAAERYPAYAELGLAPVPACQRLAACVEEQIKLLDPDSKNPGPHEMPQLVHYDEQREGEYYLKGFN